MATSGKALFVGDCLSIMVNSILCHGAAATTTTKRFISGLGYWVTYDSISHYRVNPVTPLLLEIWPFRACCCDYDGEGYFVLVREYDRPDR
jgi:hypothetical protein